jgi:excisionase family DNA binding protein
MYLKTPTRDFVVTVCEVVRSLEISVSLVYRLIESGKLGNSRHGLGRGVIRVSESQLAEYLEDEARGKRHVRTEPSPG